MSMNEQNNARGKRDRQGSALIVVIWVIGLLSILVSSFTFDAHIEAKITSYYRSRTKAEYLAKSGLAMSELIMMNSLMAKGVPDGDSLESEWWFPSAKRLSQGLPISKLNKELGDGTITLDIVPEPARRNVNLLKEDDWERVLDVAGVPQDMWAGLTACVLDWLDADDLPRPNGAETEDYYSKLDPPYRAKNGPMDTVGELLLVKGFTRAILSGGILETNDVSPEPVRLSGVEDMLTTYGDGKVNINAASTRVLMTLPGVDEIVAGAIVEEREGSADAKGKKENTSFRDVNDLFVRVPGIEPAVRSYITTESAIYRVTSAGTVNGVKRTIMCIARFADKHMTILQWREEDAN